jgi:hypothetical protein
MTVADGVQAIDASVQRIVTAIRVFREALPVVAVRLLPDTPVPGTYRYRWELLDGRVFTQTFVQNGAGDWLQTFSVSDAFLENEFIYHRALRQIVLDAIVEPIGLTRLVYTVS